MPLRFPRPVMALFAAGIAAVSIGVAAVPAQADQVRHREWWLTSLGINGAWAASQGSGVTVAVLSDGVDSSQPDLNGAVTTAPALAGAPVASGQYSGEQGTAIASLIAGRGHGSHGSSGIIGVAPEARVMSVPVTLPADDPQLSQSTVAAAIPDAIAAGIKYAVQHGATVIDLPIDPAQPGSSGTGGALGAAGGSSAEQSAISYALAHNVVLVAPAGDDGTASDAPNYPAAYHGVIAVGAFNSTFVKAPWSSHQSYVTLTAAGVGMLASANTGGYQRVSSTTAASAVVSGIAALIRSRYPHLTAQQIRTSMTSSTFYHPANGLAHGSGYGTVNASRAMAAAAKLSTQPADRAGAGAQPRLAPAAVAAPSATQGIESQLQRAGEISGGLLVLLLLLIALYAATGRRRRGGPPAVTAQWAERQAQSRYPHTGDFVQAGDYGRASDFGHAGDFVQAGGYSHGADYARRADYGQPGDFAQAGAFAGGFASRSGAEADRMLETFTVPVARPDRGVIGQPAGHSALGSRAEEGLFAPAVRPAIEMPGTESEAPDGTPDSGPWPVHGPASRAVSRRTPVSGTPPWEPASEPFTELPWTGGASPRHSITGRPAAAALPGPGPSEPTAWQDEPAGQSLFQPADRHPSAADGGPAGDWSPAPPTAWGTDAGDRAIGGGHSQSEQSDAGWDDRGWSPLQGAGPVASTGNDLWSRNAQWTGSDPQWTGHDPQWTGSDPQWTGHDPQWAGSDPQWTGQNPQWADSDADWNSGLAGSREPDWTSGPDWSSSPGQAGQASDVQPSWGAGDQWPDEPRTGASGLPIRRPGSALPAPLSPSGSLWEPVERDPGDTGQRDSQDPGSRPIYVWNPSTRPPSAPRYQPPPAD